MQVLSIILAILAFGVLVIVHEFGHFITAKRGGVQVNEFWIGMGPTILKHEHGGTLYCLKLLPFGGACVMEGEDGESENEHAFGKARLCRRILIVAAGALMNFAIGLLILLFAVQPTGRSGYVIPTVRSIDAGSSVLEGGMQEGDEILSIDGFRLLVRSDLNVALASSQTTSHEVKVRRDGRTVVLENVLFEARVDDGEGGKRIGITFAEAPATLAFRIKYAVLTALDDARLVWVSLGQLIGGRYGVNDLSGPVGVASTMAATAQVNIHAFLQLVAFISINLGVMNLLPLPALDGGRLVFLFIEGIRRKPVPPKYEGLVHAAGLMLLLMLMVYVTGQDILRLLTGKM